jgi:cell division protein FtsL
MALDETPRSRVCPNMSPMLKYGSVAALLLIGLVLVALRIARARRVRRQLDLERERRETDWAEAIDSRLQR